MVNLDGDPLARVESIERMHPVPRAQTVASEALNIAQSSAATECRMVE